MTPTRGSAVAVGVREGKARVVLADDYRPLWEALWNMLERDPSIEVVGEAGDTMEALDSARSVPPRVIVKEECGSHEHTCPVGG